MNKLVFLCITFFFVGSLVGSLIAFFTSIEIMKYIFMVDIIVIAYLLFVAFRAEERDV